jgi:hypothetical protein
MFLKGKRSLVLASRYSPPGRHAASREFSKVDAKAGGEMNLCIFNEIGLAELVLQVEVV